MSLQKKTNTNALLAQHCKQLAQYPNASTWYKQYVNRRPDSLETTQRPVANK